jgi:hypothetical protein
MASILSGIALGMTLSLGLAILMERVLFRGILQLMFRGPRWVKAAVAQSGPRAGISVTAIRRAGL